MATISKSGLYQNDLGESFLITQGVIGYALVAGKQFLIRYFPDPNTLSNINCVKVTISGGLISKGILVPKSDLIFEQDYPNGPSVGVIIRGFACPQANIYSVGLTYKDASFSNVSSTSTFSLSFSATQDIRFMVVPLIGSAPERNFVFTDDWNKDIDKAMERLGSMFPVRDCVHRGLGNKIAAGIRYVLAKPLEAWPDEVGIPAPDYFAETKNINSGTTNNTDRIDATILYRPVQQKYNEPPGGIAGYGGITQPDAKASCVGGFWAGLEMTAPCIAQEVGHLFGLEPMGSPHFQDINNPMHSKDAHIYDPYAFDFVNKKVYPPQGHFLGDTLNNLGSGAWQGADSVMYNAFDWEYLRQGLLNLNANSTGTEINPAKHDACAFLHLHQFPKTIPIPPAQFVEIIGSRADGKMYKWGDHGFVPVDPKGDPYAFILKPSITRLLHEFISADVAQVYIPKDNELMDIVESRFYSFHSGKTDLLHFEEDSHED